MISYESSIKIGEIIAELLQTQAGEKAKSIETFQRKNRIVIYALDCFAPAELNLTNLKDAQLLWEMKIREEVHLKSVLQYEIENTLGLTLSNFKSLIGVNGDRVFYIALSERS